MTAIAARLDEITAATQALAGRVDRIGAISEQALLTVADLHHRIAQGVPGSPPRQFGIFRWSLRQPRKALLGALSWLRTVLKEPVAEPHKHPPSAAIASPDKSPAGI